MRLRLGGRMPAALGTALALLLISVQVTFADNTLPTPSPCPSAAPAGSGPICLDQAQKKLIDDVRQRLGNQLADALSAETALENSIKQNQQAQSETSDRVAAADLQLNDLTARVAALDRQVLETDRRVQAERAQLGSLARALYFQPNSILLVMAQANSLGDMLTRVGDLSAASLRARSIKSSLDADLAAVESQKSDRMTALNREQTVRNGLQADLDQLQKLQVEELASQAALRLKIAETQNEIANADRQSADLAQRIELLIEQELGPIIAQAMQQVWQQVQISERQQGGVPIPGSSGHSTQYRFVWPEQHGSESQGFGPCSYWFEPPYQQYPHFHTGLDLVEPEGSPIVAADDGLVAAMGDGRYGYGSYVVLQHNGGFTTLYGHMLDDPGWLARLPRVELKVGQRVNQGDVIGYEGSTGNSTGPHLHFELRINDVPQDPTPYLPPGPPSDFRG